MAVEFAQIVSGGGFFKPADYASAAALLIEPTAFKENVPTNFKNPDGSVQHQDQVIADITVFRTQQDLDLGQPQVVSNAVVGSAVLAKDLAPLVGKATIQRVEKAPGKNYWKFALPSPATQTAVVAYVEKREAALDTAADDMAAVLGG